MGGGGDEFGPSGPGPACAGLPADIAFLARHGVAPSDLAEVARRAARLGVEASREIIALGLIDETEFYRAFAAELGLAFHAGPLALRPGGDYGAILREGIAPLAERVTGRFRFALAPQGAALRRMLEAGPRGRSDIAVTTPRNFADALRIANAGSLARHIAGQDAAGVKRDSARTSASGGQAFTAGAGAGIVAIGGVLAPLETFVLLALLVGPVFLA